MLRLRNIQPISCEWRSLGVAKTRLPNVQQVSSTHLVTWDPVTFCFIPCPNNGNEEGKNGSQHISLCFFS